MPVNAQKSCRVYPFGSQLRFWTAVLCMITTWSADNTLPVNRQMKANHLFYYKLSPLLSTWKSALKTPQLSSNLSQRCSVILTKIVIVYKENKHKKLWTKKGFWKVGLYLVLCVQLWCLCWSSSELQKQKVSDCCWLKSWISMDRELAILSYSEAFFLKQVWFDFISVKLGLHLVPESSCPKVKISKTKH